MTAAQKKALAAATAAKKANAEPKAEPTADAEVGLDENLDDEAPEAEGDEVRPEPEEPVEPAEPQVRTKKDAAVETRKDRDAKKAAPEIKPCDDYVYDKKGQIRVDEDGDKMQYAPGEHLSVGYVSENGVLFPNGFKYKGGHVTNGTVVLNQCPRCGHRQSIDDAISGACGNMRAGVEKAPCGYSQVAVLEAFKLK